VFGQTMLQVAMAMVGRAKISCGSRTEMVMPTCRRMELLATMAMRAIITWAVAHTLTHEYMLATLEATVIPVHEYQHVWP
jgi:hypothetical protein